MKAHFKYAFLDGLHDRGVVFAVVFVMNFVFIALGWLGLLPDFRLAVLLSLSSVAIAVMAIVNIVSDISIIRRMLSAPRAYLTALPPVPRYKMLLSNIAVMTILDLVTMFVAISGLVLLSSMLYGYFTSAFEFAYIIEAGVDITVVGGILMLIAGHLLLLMFIISCIIVSKSLFYKVRLGGLLTAAVAIGAFYLYTLTQFILTPFGTVTRIGLFFDVQIQQGVFDTLIYTIFLLAHFLALFVINFKLMERKLNI